ncbi:MAG: hypothetical protein JXR23_00585, partial [Pontiellaceae bacterium]|nr:hypothetical protein [Pontiellaceae bacterium]
EKVFLQQDFSNLVGQMLLEISIPSFSKGYGNILETQVISDLLALEIERRLGGTLELKDPFSGATYLYDEERGTYFGVGEDGVPGTDDDVYVGEQ